MKVDRYTKVRPDSAEVERSARDLLGEHFRDMKVSCPDEVRIKEGEPIAFECTATIDGHSFQTFLRRKGEDEWSVKVKHGTVALPIAAERLATHLKADEVDCGSGPFPAARGKQFACEVTSAGSVSRAMVTILNASGRVKVELNASSHENGPQPFELDVGFEP